jgi:hypothetical protein
MGLFIRKAVRLGPVRFNLSKSGVGASVGLRGLRVGETPKGRFYLFGRVLPGIYYRRALGTNRAGGAGCLVAIAAVGLMIFFAVILRA